MSVCVALCVCQESRLKADESTQQNLIYNASTDHVTTDTKPPAKDKSRPPADRDKSQRPRNGDKSRAAADVDKSAGRPVPKPRAASTSDDLQVWLLASAAATISL